MRLGFIRDETFVSILFEIEQPRLRFKASGEASQLSRRANHPMARHDDGYWISPVGCADGSGRSRVSQLRGELRVASGFAEWDREKSVPNIILETGASHVEGDGEGFSASSKIFAELTLGLDKDRMMGIPAKLAKTHATRWIVFPENRHQAIVTCDQLELPDRGWHRLIEKAHGLFFPLSDFRTVGTLAFQWYARGLGLAALIQRGRD
jgi:hypothetical protein